MNRMIVSHVLVENDSATSVPGKSDGPPFERRVRKILQLVESGTTFEVGALAAALHVSEAHLQRLFRHDTGFYLGQWLREQRLERSAHLLVSTSLSVKQIAHSVGYEHASSFSRAFERQFRQAPAHLRKEGKQTDETGRSSDSVTTPTCFSAPDQGRQPAPLDSAKDELGAAPDDP
jgi:transcriptional regulator GlxA family with amidase domain